MSTLTADGELIEDTHNEHKVELKKELKAARSQLNRVKQLEFIEKYSVSIALAIFYSVVAYIIIKRTRVLVILYHIILYLYKSYHSNNEIDQEVLIRIIETISNTSSPIPIANITLEDIINSSYIADVQYDSSNVYYPVLNETMEYL